MLLALFGQVYQTGADPWQLFWQAEAAGFLLMSLAVLGLGAAAVFWLKRLHAELES